MKMVPISVVFYFLFLAMLFAPSLSRAEGRVRRKQQIMVLDISAQGVDKKLARSLTQTVTATLGQHGDYSVTSQEEMLTMLGFEKEKEILGCEDEVSCLAEITGAMGARYLVKGSVTKVGGRWFLGLVRIDVMQARVVSRFREAVGDIGLLDDLAVKAANAVMGVGTASGGKGILMVKTEPAGAQVRVDGRDVGVAPVVVKDLFTGLHMVEASKGVLKRSRGVEVRAGQVARAFLELVAGKLRTVTVFSEPPEAKVTWDGKEVGATPVVVREVPSGSHRLEVSLAGYLKHNMRVDVTGDQELNVRLLPAMRDVWISTRPKGAKILVSEKLVGEAPVSLSLEADSKYLIKASAPGYKLLEKRVFIKPAEPGTRPQQIKFDLELFPVDVELAVNPANSLVIIGQGKSRLEHSGSGTVRLLPGRHKVLARLDGYKTVEKEVDVPLGRSSRIEFSLEPSPALLEYEADLASKRWQAWGG
ncbi:MAG: PEGA domain-containing protein, partial [Deltaproteobacteria bacterium]|nr:PEGA domain-containing protein [Deltaproteobacteria bacterium]